MIPWDHPIVEHGHGCPCCAPDVCPDCEGLGEVWSALAGRDVLCRFCGGTGEVR